jgi:hypothetical protein
VVDTPDTHTVITHGPGPRRRWPQPPRMAKGDGMNTQTQRALSLVSTRDRDLSQLAFKALQLSRPMFIAACPYRSITE